MKQDLNFANGVPNYSRKISSKVRTCYVKRYFIIGIKKTLTARKTIEKVLGSGDCFDELSDKIAAIEKAAEYGQLRIMAGTVIKAHRVY